MKEDIKENNILSKITKTKLQAPIITIYGNPGIGKTSLAASFPNPLFILTENPGKNGLSCTKKYSSFKEIFDDVRELSKIDSIPYDTIVLDSIGGLDKLVIEYIIAEEKDRNGKKKNIALGECCGGYGKGYERAQSIHNAFKSVLNRINEKGIAIIYLAHMGIQEKKSPEHDPYDTYSIMMNHQKSKDVYINSDIDAVLFYKLKSYSESLDNGKTRIKCSDQHIIVTSVNEINVSKNRFNMPSEIAIPDANSGFKELSKYIPFYNGE